MGVVQCAGPVWVEQEGFWLSELVINNFFVFTQKWITKNVRGIPDVFENGYKDQYIKVLTPSENQKGIEEELYKPFQLISLFNSVP